MLTVGIPKEIKAREKRVGLTPEAVRLLANQGILVLVEKNAGFSCGFSDGDYFTAGANIVSSPAEIYRKAQIIQKVKEPVPSEFQYFRPEHIFFSYLHLAAPNNRPLLEALLKSKATGIAYETVATPKGMPLLAPMSEIAGALSASYAAYFKHLGPELIRGNSIHYPDSFQKEMERIANHYPQVMLDYSPGKVVIWGGGVAGQKAAEFALKMKGSVTLIEKMPERREFLKEKWEVLSPEEVSDLSLAEADIFIGCVHQAGARAAQVILPEQLKKASSVKKKIMMDIAIDQGGNFPEARPTDYDKPLYADSYGNIRFAVSNIPSLCGRGASEAISRIAGPYSMALAKNFEEALKVYPELNLAINVRAGKIVHPALL